uniref:Hermansky-Pudlak syndrome 5 n=1 Tax=Melanaphis sacchari TaxID=742174 RepID=A0A2H8TP86_9HEMI
MNLKMAVLQDHTNDKNMPDHILLLNRIDIKNILNSPLKTTQRIKYTCLEVSQNFVIFGASSGGLYVFRREPCEFIQLLPNKVSAHNISKIKILGQNIFYF